MVVIPDPHLENPEPGEAQSFLGTMSSGQVAAAGPAWLRAARG